MLGSLSVNQPGSINSGTLGSPVPSAIRDGSLGRQQGREQPGAINSGSLGFMQPGAINSGSLGRYKQPGAYHSGSLGRYKQPGARNSGSLGCGCKSTSGLGTTIMTLPSVQGLGRALGALSLDLDLIVFSAIGAGAVWFLAKKKGA